VDVDDNILQADCGPSRFIWSEGWQSICHQMNEVNSHCDFVMMTVQYIKLGGTLFLVIVLVLLSIT